MISITIHREIFKSAFCVPLRISFFNFLAPLISFVSLIQFYKILAYSISSVNSSVSALVNRKPTAYSFFSNLFLVLSLKSHLFHSDKNINNSILTNTKAKCKNAISVRTDTVIHGGKGKYGFARARTGDLSRVKRT